jgi:SAM-dependent methyltransferase
MYSEHYLAINEEGPSRTNIFKFYNYIYGNHFKKTNELVLDIGCGSGIFLEWLRGKGYENIEGIDIDFGLAEHVKNKGFNVHFVEDSYTWLKESANAGKYDIVFLKDVLEHIEVNEVKPFLRACMQILNKNGVLLITTPNANSSFAARMRYVDYSHVQSFTEESLCYWLRIAGIKNFEIQGDDHYEFHSLVSFGRMVVKYFFRFIRRIEALSEFGPTGKKMILSLNLIAVVTKNK